MKFDPKGNVRLHELPGVDGGALCRVIEAENADSTDFTFFGRKHFVVKSSLEFDHTELKKLWARVCGCRPSPPFKEGERCPLDFAIRFYSFGDPVGSALISWKWDNVKIHLHDYYSAIGFDGESCAALALRTDVDELLPPP